MSLFRRPERRAVTSIAGWGRGDDAVLGSSTGASLSVVPVFAACRLISDAIATLPLQAYRKADGQRTPIPLPAVFDKETRIEWVQQALMSLLLHGNAYGWVVARAGDGTPQTVVWLDPERVQVDESRGLPIFRYNGREIPSVDIKHIPAYSIPGTVVGVSPIGACSMLTDTGAVTQKMMRDWFKGRAVPGVTMKNSEKTFDFPVAEALSDRLRARLKNGEPFVHGKDWDINVMSMPAQDAGFIESAKLNATQVATIYGIPPEMIGGETGASLTYSTVEMNMINFATLTLRPWVAKLEQEFSAWIHSPRFVKFNVDAAIRVDTKTRYEVHQIARTIGLNNIDELRILEDAAPLPDGQGQSYAPLAQLAASAKESREVAERSAQRAHELALREAEKQPIFNMDARTNVNAPTTVHPAKFDMDARTTILTPETPVTLVDERDAPTVNLTVEPTPVVNEVNPTPVVVENNNHLDVHPTPLVMAHPKRTKTTSKVSRDKAGEITGSTAETEVIEE